MAAKNTKRHRVDSVTIPLSRAYITGGELRYIRALITDRLDLAGDGKFTQKVHNWFQTIYGVKRALLTTSGTTALEMAAWLMHLRPGDEVIAPSFTFSSTINALLLQRGVRVVFADIDTTVNIDPQEISKRITPKTKAIMVVHYAGIAADMNPIMTLARQAKLKVIEDAAQGIESYYRNQRLGTIGDVGCLSFHGSKNITCGEGGLLCINTPSERLINEAEIIREKGTNRTKFLRGIIDKYTWVNLGSSYLPSELNAAFLYAQLESAQTITQKRIRIFNRYMRYLQTWEDREKTKLPVIPDYARHNAHIFYILLPTRFLRDQCMKYLRSKGIGAAFHYIPLHNAPFGKKNNLNRPLPKTVNISGRLLRLPIYSDMTTSEQTYVIGTLGTFLKKM